MATNEEEQVDSHQCQAQVDQNFTMDTSSLLSTVMLIKQNLINYSWLMLLMSNLTFQ